MKSGPRRSVSNGRRGSNAISSTLITVNVLFIIISSGLISKSWGNRRHRFGMQNPISCPLAIALQLLLCVLIVQSTGLSA